METHSEKLWDQCRSNEAFWSQKWGVCLIELDPPNLVRLLLVAKIFKIQNLPHQPGKRRKHKLGSPCGFLLRRFNKEICIPLPIRSPSTRPSAPRPLRASWPGRKQTKPKPRERLVAGSILASHGQRQIGHRGTTRGFGLVFFLFRARGKTGPRNRTKRSGFAISSLPTHTFPCSVSRNWGLQTSICFYKSPRTNEKRCPVVKSIPFKSNKGKDVSFSKWLSKHVSAASLRHRTRCRRPETERQKASLGHVSKRGPEKNTTRKKGKPILRWLWLYPQHRRAPANEKWGLKIPGGLMSTHT